MFKRLAAMARGLINTDINEEGLVFNRSRTTVSAITKLTE